MKIYYNRSQQRLMLILSFVFLIIGAGSAMLEESAGLTAFIGIGAMYLFIYVYREIKQYAFVTDSYILLNSVPGKKMNIADITSVNKFAGDFIFKSADRELRVDTNFVDKKSMPELELFVSKVMASINRQE